MNCRFNGDFGLSVYAQGLSLNRCAIQLRRFSSLGVEHCGDYFAGGDGILTTKPAKRRTSGRKINTTGKAINQDTIQVANHFEKKFSMKPTLINILMQDKVPLIKNDKHKGIIQAKCLACNFGIEPMIMELLGILKKLK